MPTNTILGGERKEAAPCLGRKQNPRNDTLGSGLRPWVHIAQGFCFHFINGGREERKGILWRSNTIPESSPPPA